MRYKLGTQNSVFISCNIDFFSQKCKEKNYEISHNYLFEFIVYDRKGLPYIGAVRDL